MEFFSRYKKAILVIGFLILVIILGYVIFSLFFKPIIGPGGTGQQPATSTPGQGFPAAGTSTGGAGGIADSGGTAPDGLPAIKTLPSATAQGGLTKTEPIVDNEALSPTLDANGNGLQYYDPAGGKFYRVNNDGEIALLSDKVFHNVESITWAPDKNKAVLEYPDGANIVYDFQAEKQVTLPQHWEDFDFSPDSGQLVMKSLGLDPENRWLAISNTDGTKIRALEALGENEANVYSAWSPNKQIVAMYTEGKDFDRQEVYFVGLNGENFKSTVVEGRGFQPKWSPDGQRLAYSVYSSANDLKPSLWVVNAQGDSIGTNRKNLGIETWAEKCSFADTATLYCAVPRRLEAGSGLFTELADATTDYLYKIDTQTGQKRLVAIPEGDHTISNIIVSANGYNLYFTDARTGKIYTIKLK